jgi:hypothetical protein
MDKYEVTTELRGKHPIQTEYPLLPGDVITKSEDGTWMKHAPGLAILGFILTSEDEDTLIPTDKVWVI